MGFLTNDECIQESTISCNWVCFTGYEKLDSKPCYRRAFIRIDDRKSMKMVEEDGDLEIGVEWENQSADHVCRGLLQKRWTKHLQEVILRVFVFNHFKTLLHLPLLHLPLLSK
ncbi:hypothetical protein E3N88_06433 [Mikania micrantha]|uniref:Uncharacterized protein n=1 Tax=Mikania micrantha TaxID=192012 RepID=A0A5N6PQT4_9ASTR|nr:hypothetical protein E3N88_06433 [Mikania micrantha]